jgi:hypothetical protein
VQKTAGSEEEFASLFDRLTARFDDLDGSPEPFAANILALQDSAPKIFSVPRIRQCLGRVNQSRMMGFFIENLVLK